MGLRQCRKGWRRAIENKPIQRPRGRKKGRNTMNRRIIPFMLVARVVGAVTAQY